MLKTKLVSLIRSLFGQLTLKRIVMLILGSMITAFGLFNIHAQSNVTEGGVLGLSLLLGHWLNISPSLISFILNICCYILGWRLLGNDFIGCSAIAGIAYSVFYAVFESIGPLFPWIADKPLLAALMGAPFIGVGAGIAVRAGGAPGGDDALAMSLAFITKLNIKWLYLFSDMVVLLLSLTYIPLGKILYSLLTVILSGQIIGIVAEGKKGKKDGKPGK